MPLRSGETFAGFRIVRLLGSGGMGEVYLAQHPRLPRQDALKILPEDVSADAEYRARFNREADLASKLYHPHIVGLHDRGEHNGQLWISMDFVDGVDAARLLAEKYPAGMPVDQVVPIITAVANALDYAHKRGLLHRDVKPANIMLSHLDDEDEQRIMLADFGIARDVGDISGLTATNTTVGTVAYSAPEQLMGEEVDGRADQYALAATAYHLLTGIQLFPHSRPTVVISRHLNSSPPALADTRLELAPLDPAVAKALAKDPNDRFQRCADFARALAEQALVNATHHAAPTTPAHRHPGSSTVAQQAPSAKGVEPTGVGHHRRRRGWLIAGAVATTVLVAAVAVWWRPWAAQHPQPTPSSSQNVTTAAPSTSNTLPPTATPSPRVFPASAIDTVLLTPAEINTLVAGPGDPLMQVEQTTYGMLNNANLVTPPACVGMIFTGERAVFADTGYTAMHTERLKQPPPTYNISGPQQVEQTVVVYDTPEQAQVVLAASQRQWQSCANGKVRLGTVGQNGENNLYFNVGRVQVGDGSITVPMVANSQESGGSACQQVMAVRANVVVGARACRYPEPPLGQLEADVSSVRSEAEPLANAMIDKVTV